MGNDVSAEIGEMINMLGSSEVDDKVDDENLDTTLPDDEGVDDEGDDNLDEDGDDKDDKLSTDANDTSKPDGTKPDEKDAIIANLTARLDALEKAAKKPEEEPKPFEPEEQDFIGDLDPEYDLKDKESLNKILNQVYSKGIHDTRKSLEESLPNTIASKVDLILKVKEARDNFYNENKDLKPFNNVVATIFGEISAKDPSRPYSDILKDVAAEARKRLNLKTTTEKDDGGKPPRLPGKKGSSGKLPTDTNTNPLRNELEEMNKALGR